MPFAAWLAWTVAFAVGFELEALATYLCPADKVVSDMCTASWYRPVFDAIMSFCAALAAGLIVLLCTLIAPTSRERVARLMYLVGASVAIWMAIGARAVLPLVCALVVGALVWRWFDRRPLWPIRL